jgi:osmoprotectant transport system substrate-binding protein
VTGGGRSSIKALAGLLGLALAACVPGGGPGPAQSPIGGVAPSSSVTVASFNFPESEVIAQIYGQAMQRAGYPVQLLQGVGPRELLEPALARGLVDFVPEYSGSALQFLTLGRKQPNSQSGATHLALERAVGRRGLTALDAAPGQDANAIVVTSRTAERLGLRSVGDLATDAPGLAFGGPPECPDRELCLRGLGRTYGVHFGEFVSLDAGGPLTLQALRAGQVDVALMFSSDPAIPRYHLVALADDRGLQPAENVTPVIRRAVVARYGPKLVRLVDGVSAHITTDVLRSLNEETVLRGARPEQIAAGWLDERGIG